MMFDIQWAPDDKDCFLLVWQQDIYLLSMHLDHYCASSYNNAKNRTVSKFMLSVLGIWRNSVQQQCVTWFPTPSGRNATIYDPRYLVAVSTLRGDITLLSLREDDHFYDKFKLHKKELRICNPRCCTALYWNSWKPNLLAQTLEKIKYPRDPSVLIWDVTKPATLLAKAIDFRNVNLSSAHEESLQFNVMSFDDRSIASLPGLVQVYDNHYSDVGRSMLTEVTTCDKPMCEVGSQETTHSFAWLSKSSFIVGMSEKYLKIFDLSDTSKACQITNTKAVYGLTVDPLCTSRIASFVERQVSLWRLDSIDKPVYTFIENENICRIKWSPNKYGWLAVLIGQSNFIKLYDTYPMFLQSLEESEQVLLEHIATPASRSPSCILAFSWHPTLHNCLITLDQDGCVDVAQLISGASLTWSPNQTIAWSRLGDWFCTSKLNTPDNLLPGDAVLQTKSHNPKFKHWGVSPPLDVPVDPEASYQHLDGILQADIATVMRKRADLGYGSCSDLGAYVKITADDKQLRTMWTWIAYMQEKVDSSIGHLKSTDGDAPRFTLSALKDGRCSPRHFGVLSILHSGDPGSSDSVRPSTEVIYEPQWEGVDAFLPFPRYRSAKRSRILRLCMWPLDDNPDVQRQAFESLIADGQFERAATMALINLKFDWALSFLNRAVTSQRSTLSDGTEELGANPLTKQDIGLVTLALVGYSSGNNDLWQNTCASLLNRLDNPYLNVMFSFMSHEDRSFDAILHNENVHLIDRLAFACLYLDDGQLLTFVRTMCVQMVQAGRLEGVLLTGLVSVDFVMLLQHYVDSTGDVQTAAIAGLHLCGLVSCDTENWGRKTGPSQRSGLSTTGHRRLIGEDKGYKSRLSVAAARRASLASGADMVTLFLQLTGHRLALWVQTYRDLLDQWSMWFARAEFDTTHRSRILSDYMLGSTRPLIPGSLSIGLPSHPTSTESRAGEVTPLVLVRRLSAGGNCKVRSAGLVAGTSQVFVACSYCGNRLGPQLTRMTTNSTTVSNTTDAANAYWDAAASNYTPIAGTVNFSMQGGGGKQTICLRCRQSLPRCSICLMHLGTTAASSAASVATEERLLHRMALTSLSTQRVDSSATEPIRTSILGVHSDVTSLNTMRTPQKGSPQQHKAARSSERLPLSMPNWFVWCQACRHGGHAIHLFEWFYGTRDRMPGEVKTSTASPEAEVGRLCPVSGCQCYCASLDFLKTPAAVTTSSLPFSRQSAYHMAVKSGGFMPSVLKELLASVRATTCAEVTPSVGGGSVRQETKEFSVMEPDGESRSGDVGESRADGEGGDAEVGAAEDPVLDQGVEGGLARGEVLKVAATQSDDQQLSNSYPSGITLDDLVLHNYDLLQMAAADRPGQP